MLKIHNKKEMEEITKQSIEKICQNKASFDAMIASRFVDCDFDAMTMTIEYPVQRWELNPAGTLHGGVIAAIFDISMAVLILPYAGGFAPTINLDVKFIRPVKEGDTLVVKGHIISFGKNLAHAEAKAHSKTTGTISSAATGIYSLKLWNSYLKKE